MTDLDRRYDLVRLREKSTEFIFGVQTTRIACRPGCPSRTPRPENVRFFADFPAARAAGFRACKRCAPDDRTADADRERLVTRACALIDADETASFAAIARAVGLSRFHFQRIVRAVLGVTPGEYRRARRQQRLRGGLSAGRSVTDAIAAAGFGSPSRAYEAQALGMTPSTFRAGACGERIIYAIGTSSLGRVLVATTSQGPCAVELGADDGILLAALEGAFPHAECIGGDRELAHDLATVLERIDREAADSALELDVRCTAFQRRVWNALRANRPPTSCRVRSARDRW